MLCDQTTGITCRFLLKSKRLAAFSFHIIPSSDIWQCTLIFPSWAPVANISVSLLKHMHSTASSIIMKLSWAWYFRSWIINKARHQFYSVEGFMNVTSHVCVFTFLIFPVVKFHTSMKPSTEPVTRYCPSGENREHSTWDFCPNCSGKKRAHQHILDERNKNDSKESSHYKNLDLSAELGGETLLLHILDGSFTPEQVDSGTRREETLMLLPLQRLKKKPVDTVMVTQHLDP